MASEEKIVNKIIPIETIVEVANYLEEQKKNIKNCLIEMNKKIRI